MCTVTLLRRPGAVWPLLMAANRDEMADRPWRAPGRHWPDRQDVVAGLDLLAGGSWMGWNDHGVVAAVLNRRGTLGPARDRRSRGELVLEALDHGDAAAAAEALEHLDCRSWRPFNLVIADDRDAFCLYHRGDTARPEVVALPPGCTMITASDGNDTTDARIRRYLPRFAAVAVPEPGQGLPGWQAWADLLAQSDTEPGAGPEGGLCFALPSGFGTVCATLLALPDRSRTAAPPRVLFAAGPPGRTRWRALGGEAEVEVEAEAEA